MKKNLSKEEMTTFLEKFSSKIDSDNIEIYKKIMDGSQLEHSNDPEDFYYMVLYPFERFVNGFLGSKFKSNNDLNFIYKNYRFLESHFGFVIKKYEGIGCYADKVRTILSGLVRFFEVGKEITFDYDGEFTYHLPKKVFKTHDLIVGFYKGLNNLWSGNPTEYLLQMVAVNEAATNGES